MKTMFFWTFVPMENPCIWSDINRKWHLVYIEAFDNQTISDTIVFGLSFFSGDNDCRKTEEMRLIHRLGTINPNGEWTLFFFSNFFIFMFLFIVCYF